MQKEWADFRQRYWSSKLPPDDLMNFQFLDAVFERIFKNAK
jgi:hypothetical protein